MYTFPETDLEAVFARVEVSEVNTNRGNLVIRKAPTPPDLPFARGGAQTPGSVLRCGILPLELCSIQRSHNNYPKTGLTTFERPKVAQKSPEEMEMAL